MRKVDVGTVARERDVLIALLLDMPLGPPCRIMLDEMSAQEKIFLLAAACAQMNVAAICEQAVDLDDALEGLDTLFADMRRNIERRFGE